MTTETQTPRLLLFFSSAFGAAVLAVVLISTFTFMVFTASRMMVNREARSMFEEKLPEAYLPVSYREKSRNGQRARYLLVEVHDDAKQAPGRLEVFEVSGEEYYRKYLRLPPYAMIDGVRDYLEEIESPADRFRTWHQIGETAGCSMYFGQHGRRGKTPVAIVLRNNEQASRLTAFVRYAPTPNGNDSPHQILAALKGYCKNMNAFQSSLKEPSSNG